MGIEINNRPALANNTETTKTSPEKNINPYNVDEGSFSSFKPEERPKATLASIKEWAEGLWKQKSTNFTSENKITTAAPKEQRSDPFAGETEADGIARRESTGENKTPKTQIQSDAQKKFTANLKKDNPFDDIAKK